MIPAFCCLPASSLSGRITRHITLLTHLTELSFHRNQLTGPIDENLWFLPQLRSLDLSENMLTGSLTESIG
jgi:Leucine-rich repeat (LRR) protein